MINPHLEILKLVQIIDLNIVSLLAESHIPLVFQRCIVIELLLQDVGERIRQLEFGDHDLPQEESTAHLDLVNVLENIFLEALIYERFDVKLQVDPHPLLNNCARDSGMQWLSMDIVFAICIRRRPIKDKTFLFIIHIRKYNFQMKALFIKDFTLENHKRLNYTQAMPSKILGRRHPRSLICNVKVAFNLFVESFLHRTLEGPLVHGLFILYI